MLGKLIKHEFRGTYKRFVQLFLVLIAIAAATRIFVSISQENVILNLITVVLSFLYGVGFVVLFIGCAGYNADRFYKNLTQDQGYLSMTLPVTVSQHIVSKTVVAVVWTILTYICCGILSAIVFWGRGFEKIPADIVEIVREINQYGLWGTAIEGVFAFLLSMMFIIFMSYSCIAEGQLLGKHRKGAALIALVVNVVIFLWAVIGEGWCIDKFVGDQINTFSELHIFQMFLHMMIVGMIVFSVIYFIITKYVFEKKFNIE